MQPDTASLIEECTNGTTKTALYLSRVGLEKNFNDPNKPGRPKFKSVPVLSEFYAAATQEVDAIVATYESRKAIRKALRLQDICLDDIARDCLNSYGQQIWNNGLERRFVLSIDTIPTLSKIKGHAQVVEDKYLRHLIYEHPSDKHKIRLQVSAWIIQRACRKAENNRRKGRSSRKGGVKASMNSSSFIKEVRVHRDRRTRSPSLSPDDMVDELALEFSANSSVEPKRVVQSDHAHPPEPRSSRKTYDVLQTPTKRRHKQSVAVVVSPRKPWSTKITGVTNRKRNRSKPLCNTTTTLRSARSKRKDDPKGIPQIPDPCCTTPRRMKTETSGERPVKHGADANVQSLVRQLDHDRNELGLCLPDLLSPHNPECHSIADIKQTTGLIDTITLNDVEGLRKTLGKSHDKCRIALDRWLGCVKTLVEFREITNLEGDEDAIEDSFPSLLSHIKKEARMLRHRKRQEIVKWFGKPGPEELEFTIASFSTEVASMLLEMTSWGGLQKMNLEELLDDMIPFTKRLLEWFRAVPTSSTTRN